jgi:hypothetical protein
VVDLEDVALAAIAAPLLLLFRSGALQIVDLVEVAVAGMGVCHLYDKLINCCCCCLLLTTHGQVVDLEEVAVADIAAGGWHSMALSADGQIYVWGRCDATDCHPYMPAHAWWFEGC